MLALTNKLVEDQRRAVKSDVRTAQRTIRTLESEIAILHSQCAEAEAVLRNQKESDKQIRKVVEAKFADALNQIGEHIARLNGKLETQREQHDVAQRRYVEVIAMFQELQQHRLYADPFVRRRAENLVRGLLRNLNEADLKEQEERESAMQTSYQQWKAAVEYCAEKEHQLSLMQIQEKTVRDDLQGHLARIEHERGVYRQRVKLLKAKDDEQSAKLRILEETLSEKARNERRKLHFEQAALDQQHHRGGGHHQHHHHHHHHKQRGGDDGDGGDGEEEGGSRPDSRAAEDAALAEYEERLRKVIMRCVYVGLSGILLCGLCKR